MEKVMQQKTSRIAYLDVLKGVSMLLVIYCHGVILPDHTYVGNYLMAMAWGAVPCFIMASGAVLHQSREFCWKKHGKRLCTMYLTLMLWRIIYLIVYRVAGKVTDISFGKVLKYLIFLQDYEGVDTGVMWYMIAYLGLMIVYPITHYLFCDESHGRQVAFYMMALSAITGILFPSAEWLLEKVLGRDGEVLPLQAWNGILTFGNSTNLLFYFLLGAFLYEYRERINEKIKKSSRDVLSVILLLVGTLGLVEIKYIETGLLVWNSTYLEFGYIRCSTVLVSLGIYGLCEGLAGNQDSWAVRIIGEKIGKNTLGIYYMHYILLAVFSWLGLHDLCKKHYFVGMNLIKTIVVMVICGGLLGVWHWVSRMGRNK